MCNRKVNSVMKDVLDMFLIDLFLIYGIFILVILMENMFRVIFFFMFFFVCRLFFFVSRIDSFLFL